VIIEKMNIAETETSVNAIAKVCGCKEKNVRKVTYSFLIVVMVSVSIRETSY
jgi:hypothetical protein